MNSNDIRWFRVYHDTFDDDKLLDVALETEETLATVWGVWLALLSIASKSSPRDGRISLMRKRPTAEAYILPRLGLADLDRTRRIVEALASPDLEMLDLDDERGWYIVHWTNNQTYSDHSGAERQARYRERQKEKDESRASPLPDSSSSPAKGIGESTETATPDLKNTNTEDDIIQGVVEHFVNQTGHWPPADPKQSERDWENPVRDWLRLANGSAELVEDWINQALSIHRSGDYAHTRPKSLATTIGRIASQEELKGLWSEAKQLVSLHGAYETPEMGVKMAKVIKAVGGWKHFCGLNESVAKEKFTQAYGKVSSYEQRNKKSG